MAESVISDQTKQSLHQIAHQLSQIRNKLLIITSTLTPTNYLEEMDKFFKSDSYNPVYHYKKTPVPQFAAEKKGLYEKIKKLEVAEELKEHLEDVLADLDLLESTRRSIGTDSFPIHANELFNWGHDRLDMLLTNTPKVTFALYNKHHLQDASQIKKQFEKVLGEYGITDLKVSIDTFSTHIISITGKGIKIGSKVKRYKCNVDRLIVHEIESHALQEINTLKNPNKLCYLTKYSNMHLYAEGLAVFNEIHTRKITPEAFDTYYNRIRAVHLLNKSFREIFESLAKYLPEKNAYVATYRVKRGMMHTKEPGGFPKDAAYLLGYHEIDNLITEGFPKKLLYATKSPVLTTLLNKHGLLKFDKLITPKF